MMSGTSLDGLDLALCHFWQEEGNWRFTIEETETRDYPEILKKQLQDAIHLKAVDLLALDSEYGKFLGNAALQFLNDRELSADLIASHGHTVHHRPELGFTQQIGQGQQIANITGIRTINDFRSQDISLGGQGAPLVPIGDSLFFNEYNYCLNLGGISNVSLEKNGQRIAYDIGIANMLLNYISEKLDMAYDKGGTIARSGDMDQNLLDQLNALPYYQLPYPKSTGYEWFRSEIVPLIENSDLSEEDLLNTSVHHICEQIAVALLSHSVDKGERLFITGGGARNDYLIEVLRQKLDHRIEIVIPEDKLVSFKEALVFAFMGLLRSKEEINVLASVTGATKDSSSGIIHLPA